LRAWEGDFVKTRVTLALALFRGFPWKRVRPYWGAQLTGTFFGAAIVFLLFAPVIDHFNLVHHLSRASGGAAGVFFTHPGPAITPMHAFSDEIVLTAFLLFGIFAITEQFNDMAPKANFGALMIGFLVALLGASMGYLEGWAMNPARDLGPRLFAYVAGWGSSAQPSPDNYWWTPVVAPPIGAVIWGWGIPTAHSSVSASANSCAAGRTCRETVSKLADTCDVACDHEYPHPG
jgi:glycerol uptake facilitator protein